MARLCTSCFAADAVTVDEDGSPACMDCAVYSYIETEQADR